MMTTFYSRATRLLLAIVGLTIAAGVAHSLAQSITVTPNRNGQPPLNMSSSSFPGAVGTSTFPAGGSIQVDVPTGAGQVNSGNLTGSTAFTVQNSTYAYVHWMGVKGQDTNTIADNCYLTVVRTNATTLTVTCNRTTIGNSDGPANPSYSVQDLNSAFVDSVQWGTATTAAVFTFTACPAGTAKTEVDYLGLGPVNASGDPFRGYLQLASATTVSLTANTASTIAGVQVVCWK